MPRCWQSFLPRIKYLLLYALLQAGEKGGRCGWRWCLQQLAAAAPAVAGADGAAAVVADAAAERDAGGDGDGGRDWNPLKLVRDALHSVDVYK